MKLNIHRLQVDLEAAEECVREFEKKSIEMIHSEEERKKQLTKKAQSFNNL